MATATSSIFEIARRKVGVLLLLASALKTAPTPLLDEEGMGRLSDAAVNAMVSAGYKAVSVMEKAKEDVRIVLGEINSPDLVLTSAAAVCMLEVARGPCSDEMRFSLEILLANLMRPEDSVVSLAIQSAFGVVSSCNQLHSEGYPLAPNGFS